MVEVGNMGSTDWLVGVTVHKAPSRGAIRGARERSSALEAELMTCTTSAMVRCVRESLTAARARLALLERGVAS
jgi:hypothetical protein